MTDEFKIDKYRNKLRYSLSARFLLRFHVTLILLFSVFVGWIADLALLYNGVWKMSVRYPFAIIAAYFGFIAGVHLWIEYSGIKEYLTWRKSRELVGDDVPEGGPLKRSTDWADFSGADPSGCLVNEGCLWVFGIGLALFVLFFFFGGYIVLNAAAFLSEVVLEVLLAAGLLKGLRSVEASGWIIGVWRATRASLAFTLTVALLFGWWAQSRYPSAYTFPQVIKAVTQ